MCMLHDGSLKSMNMVNQRFIHDGWLRKVYWWWFIDDGPFAHHNTVGVYCMSVYVCAHYIVCPGSHHTIHSILYCSIKIPGLALHCNISYHVMSKHITWHHVILHDTITSHKFYHSVSNYGCFPSASWCPSKYNGISIACSFLPSGPPDINHHQQMILKWLVAIQINMPSINKLYQ